MNKYEVKIVSSLLSKYYKRKSIYKDAQIKRRIDLPISKVLKDYASYNVDMNQKELANKAILTLENLGFISTTKLSYSDDYQKIYLVETNVALLEEYASSNLNLTPRTFEVEKIKEVIKDYKNKGELMSFYITELEHNINDSAIGLDSIKEQDILKALDFLEHNDKFLYLREASMLIFGDSKYFENNRKAQIHAILLRYYTSKGEAIFEDENLLERFNIYDTNQDICIKGPVSVLVNGKELDISGLSGGVSFSIKDIDRIDYIGIQCSKVITVENKISFLRMKDDVCCIYLGGFATKPQIAFIKRMIECNPDKDYYHFGDIDAGGFWIHKKLCEQTNYHFSLMNMNVSCLMDEKYKSCCKVLTDTDRKRLINLKHIDQYAECIEYMLLHNVKLEQEIISLFES